MKIKYDKITLPAGPLRRFALFCFPPSLPLTNLYPVLLSCTAFPSSLPGFLAPLSIPVLPPLEPPPTHAPVFFLATFLIPSLLSAGLAPVTGHT